MNHKPFTYDHYRFILDAALEVGYQFGGFGELAAMRQNDRLLCVLRHDCDNDLPAAVRLARIEAEKGIRSTYFVMLRSALYNVLAPLNAGLVREILGFGHWLGLHFDERMCTDLSVDAISKLVDRERQWLADEFGQAVEVVSFHQPTGRVLEQKVRLNCLNAYDRNDMAGLFYVSDSNLTFRHGCPSEMFRSRNHRQIQLLLHPEWWTEIPMPVADKWNLMLADNFELMQQSLIEREDAYKEPHRILFVRRER